MTAYDNMMNPLNYLEDKLTEKYGVLMTIENLAEVLNRSKNGLRITLQQDNEMSRLFNQARQKLGRRVYFTTQQVAQILFKNSQILGL